MAKDAVRHVALTDAVHARLLEMIMDNTLGPGESLRVTRLAETLGTSQTPVRESLARLEGHGLVERTPMRGFTVAQLLDADEVDMLMRTRLLIEPEVAADAAEHGSAELLEALGRNLTASRATEVGTRFDDYREYLELSAQFHSFIGVACGNRFLRESLAALPVHLQRFRLFRDGGVTDVDVSLDEHSRILRSLQKRDAEGARSAMAAHLHGVHSRASDATRG